MINKIDETFKNKNNMKIMTHIVAGYPDIKANLEIVKIMADSGVSFIEVQIPFSDPLADGPTIMQANQYALDKGIKVKDCFTLVEKIIKIVEIPILFMSYINIPYRIGFENFIQNSYDSGISGFIIPDMPFDEEINNFFELSLDKNIYVIPVISPDINVYRLTKILQISKGFIYSTLKVGVTGVQKNIKQESFDFLNMLRKKTNLPIAGGFGISNIEQINQLSGLVDVVVIGSHLINLLDLEGLTGAQLFLKELSKSVYLA